jgi:hypothetical protein
MASYQGIAFDTIDQFDIITKSQRPFGDLRTSHFHTDLFLQGHGKEKESSNLIDH